MAFVGISLTTLAGAAVVGGLAYEANKSKQAAKSQRNALASEQQQDMQATAKSQADAANEANSLRVAQKRAYQANALALGGNQDDSLGLPGSGAAGAGSVLAQGASGSIGTVGGPSYTTSSYSGGTALGAGALGGGGGVYAGGNKGTSLRNNLR